MSDQAEQNFAFDPTEQIIGIQTADELPAKLYFRIGEVSKLTGLKAHVLRYWETEFPSIAPKKMGSNHRMYRRKDVEFILEIKHLLYEKRFTIEGARKHLEAKPKAAKAKPGRKGPSLVAPEAMPKVQAGLFVVDPPPAPLGTPPAASSVSRQRLAQWRAELTAIRQLLES